MVAKKSIEARIKRMAARQLLLLKKSKRRDPYAVDYDKFMLEDANGKPVFGHEPFEYSANLDEIETYLKRGK
jgi:hypothetical protein